MNAQKQFFRRHFLVMLLLSACGLAEILGQSAKVLSFATLSNEAPTEYLYFDLNCNVDAWEGYFAPSRWARNLRATDRFPTADSVAITTTAPNEVTVGGHEFFTEEWSIEIPVPGYLSFRLLPMEAVRTNPIQVMINDQVTTFTLRADGLYYSPYFRAGDQFVLRFPAGETKYQWTKLLFHTNYSAVIVRPAEANFGERFVPVSADLIQRVFFPSDAPGKWPLFDRDGDFSTLHDQSELRSTDERFDVEYTDEVVKSKTGYLLQRTFVIREKCSRGNWLRTSRNWVELPIIME